ncbi:MAG: diacylglycerol/polyprenol kinase family protein [Bacteroidota bacterium]
MTDHQPSPETNTPAAKSGKLDNLEQAATINFRSELARKTIHLFSLSIPLIYFFISRSLALMLLIPLTAAFVGVDLARFYIPVVGQWFTRWFGWLLRKHEQNMNVKRLNGASHVLISATLCVLLFPKIITINAFAILIISDSTSALFGRRFGRHRFLGKSLEGSIAFFVSAVLVIFAAPKVRYLPMEYFIGIIAAAVGAVVEAFSVHIDDNLSIPLSVGIVMWGLYLWLLPSVNVFGLQ